MLGAYSAHAVTLNPSSGTYAPGAIVNFSLVASPPAQSGITTVTIGLTASSNMEILAYTPPSSGWLLTLPDCTGGVYFTSTQICATLGKTTAITAGESLGTVQVRFTSAGTGYLTRNSENAYANTEDSFSQTGNAGSYTISSSLPSTAIGDDPRGQLTLAVVVGLVVLLGAITISTRPSIASANKNNYT